MYDLSSIKETGSCMGFVSYIAALGVARGLFKSMKKANIPSKETCIPSKEPFAPSNGLFCHCT